MLKHYDKTCPRCSNKFECKVGSILLCQCTTVKLNEAEKDYISSDCHCADCMKELKAEYHNKSLKNKIKKLLRIHGAR